MKHFLKKRNLLINGAGGAKSSSPPPPSVTQYPNVLAPPQIGKMNTLSSFSYAEIVDLLSDGPIEGLVNKFGQKVYDENIFEGIYFNDVPIKESSKDSSEEVPIDFIAKKLKELWGCDDLVDPVLIPSRGYIKLEIKKDEIDDSNFLSAGYLLPISITSYHPDISADEYIKEIGADVDNIPLIKKSFEQSPLLGERPFFTKINIPRFHVYLSKSKFDANEGGDGQECPIKIGMINLANFIYFSIGGDSLTNFNYFELPRSYVANTVYTPSGKKTIRKVLQPISNAGLDSAFLKYEIQDLNIYLWSIYSSEVGIKKVQDVIDKYFRKIIFYQNDFSLFNYNLVQAEFKGGAETQTPLKYFNSVSIDTEYNKELIGPYRLTNSFTPTYALGAGGVQRLLTFNEGELGITNVSLEKETSDDIRSIKRWPVEYSKNGSVWAIDNAKPNYAAYDSTTINRVSQEASPVTHYITNQNVECVYVTLNVNSLYDINHIDLVDSSVESVGSNKYQFTTPPPAGTETYASLPGLTNVISNRKSIGYFLTLDYGSESYIVDGGRTLAALTQNLNLLISTTTSLYNLATSSSSLGGKVANITSFINTNLYKANSANGLAKYLLPRPSNTVPAASLQVTASLLKNGDLFSKTLKLVNNENELIYPFGLQVRENLTSGPGIAVALTNIDLTSDANLAIVKIINDKLAATDFKFFVKSYDILSVSTALDRKNTALVDIGKFIDFSLLYNTVSNTTALNAEITPQQAKTITSKIDSQRYVYIQKYIVEKGIAAAAAASLSNSKLTKYQLMGSVTSSSLTATGGIFLVGISASYLLSNNSIWIDSSVSTANKRLSLDALDVLLRDFGFIVNDSLYSPSINKTLAVANRISSLEITNALLLALKKLDINLVTTNSVFDFAVSDIATQITNSGTQFYLPSVVNATTKQFNSSLVYLKYSGFNSYIDGYDFIVDYRLFRDVAASAVQQPGYSTRFMYQDLSKPDDPKNPVENNTIKNVIQTLAAGSKMPAVVSVKVETGYESNNEDEYFSSDTYSSCRFDIYGVSNEGAMVDIGARYYKNVESVKLAPPRGNFSRNLYTNYYNDQTLFLFKVTIKQASGSYSVPVTRYFIKKSRSISSQIVIPSTTTKSIPFEILELDVVNKQIIYRPHSPFDQQDEAISSFFDAIKKNGIKTNKKFSINDDGSATIESLTYQDIDTYKNYLNEKIFNKANSDTFEIPASQYDQFLDKDTNQDDYVKLNIIEAYSSLVPPSKQILYDQIYPMQAILESKSISNENLEKNDIYLAYVGEDSSTATDYIKIEVSNFFYDSYGVAKTDSAASAPLSNNLLKEIYVVAYSAFDYKRYAGQDGVINFTDLFTSPNSTIKTTLSSYSLKDLIKKIYPTDAVFEIDGIIIRATNNSAAYEDVERFSTKFPETFGNKSLFPLLTESNVETSLTNSFTSIRNIAQAAIKKAISTKASQLDLEISTDPKLKSMWNSSVLTTLFDETFSSIVGDNISQKGVQYFNQTPGTFAKLLLSTNKLRVPIILKTEAASLAAERAKKTPISTIVRSWIFRYGDVVDLFYVHVPLQQAKDNFYLDLGDPAFDIFPLYQAFAGFSSISAYDHHRGFGMNFENYLCLRGSASNMLSINPREGPKSDGYFLSRSSSTWYYSKERGDDGFTLGLTAGAVSALGRHSCGPPFVYYSDFYSNLGDKSCTLFNAGGQSICAKLVRKPASVYGSFSNTEVASAIEKIMQAEGALDASTFFVDKSLGFNSTALYGIRYVNKLVTERYRRGSRQVMRTVAEGHYLYVYAGKHRATNYTVNNLYSQDYSSRIDIPPPKEDGQGKPIRRFVKVTRVSHETLSTMISKKVSLQKVTEIIPQIFSYPFSAIVGTKIDSRAFSNIPDRSYDCKLKKVLVPSNYFPLDEEGIDVRYLRGNGEFRIYNGDWDGTFKIAWTNNPAWVLMDMLVNKRYGLGNYIESEQVDIWELYKIARWCDGVNDDGYYYGVPDGYGGTEPRHAFNAILNDNFNVFDMVNQIASIFRGHVYYMNSLITFDDDRLKPVIGEFNNLDVKDGLFNYTNFKKDDEFTAVEIAYLDEKDGYRPKVEYIEDADGIRTRGLLKKQLNAFGITSRNQARRFGKYFLYQTAKENLNVQFITDSKALLYRPGDLISIHDELINSVKNFGAVKDIKNIDDDTFEVTIDRVFDPNVFTTEEISLYTPIAKPKYEDIASRKDFIPKRFCMSSAGFFNYFPKTYNGLPISPYNSVNFYLKPILDNSVDQDSSIPNFSGGFNQSFQQKTYDSVKRQYVTNSVNIGYNVRLRYMDNVDLYGNPSKYGIWCMSTGTEDRNSDYFLFDAFNFPEIKYQIPHKKYFFEYFDSGIYVETTGYKLALSGNSFETGQSVYAQTNLYGGSGFGSGLINKFNFNIIEYQKPTISFYDVIENDRPSIETFYVESGANNKPLIETGSFTLTDPVSNKLIYNEWSKIRLSKYEKKSVLFWDGVFRKDYKASILPENGGLSNLLIGSPYSLKILNRVPKTFKVQQIQENYINEYSIFATEFNENKFLEIEENVQIDNLSNTFNYLYAYNQASKNSNENNLLKSPIIEELILAKDGAGDSFLKIKWRPVTTVKNEISKTTKYKVFVQTPSKQTPNYVSEVDPMNPVDESNYYDRLSNSYIFYYKLPTSSNMEIGTYKVSVQAFETKDGLMFKFSPYGFRSITLMSY